MVRRLGLGVFVLLAACRAASPAVDSPAVTVEPVAVNDDEARPTPAVRGLGGAWSRGYRLGPHKAPQNPPFEKPGPCERRELHEGGMNATYRYDAEGRMVERVDADGGRLSVVIRGRERVMTYERDGRSGVTVVRYDERGDIVEKRELGDDGEVVGRRVYERDDRGRLVRRSVAESGEKLKYYFAYRYDDQGREVQQDYGFYAEDGPFRRWSTQYAEDGLSATRVRTRISDGALHSTNELVYDPRGLLVKRRTVTSEGKQDRLTTWRYDDAGHVIEEHDAWQTNVTVTRWRYEGKNLVEHERDAGGDGTVESHITYRFDCR